MTRYSPRCRPRKVGTLLGIGQGEVRPLHDRTPDDADTVDLRSVGAPRQLSRRFRASLRSPPGHRRPSQTHPGQVGNPIPDLWTVWSSRYPRRILWLRPEWVSWKPPRSRKAAVAASKPCRPVESLIAKDGPRDARPRLHPIGRREIEGETIKFTLTLPGGIETESVLIPIRRRDDRLTRTLCVSSQVGCGMRCRFCETAPMGLRRHLDTADIVAQWHTASAPVVVPTARPEASFAPE